MEFLIIGSSFGPDSLYESRYNSWLVSNILRANSAFFPNEDVVFFHRSLL